MEEGKLKYKYFGIVVLIGALAYLLLEYRTYHNKKSVLQDSGFGITLMESFNSYLSENEEFNTDSFLKYLEDESNVEYQELQRFDWNIGIKVLENDTVILYEYGFDNKDDKAPQKVNLSEYSFLDYLFDSPKDFEIFSVATEGNEVLFKDDMEIELEEDIKRFKAFSDSLDLIEKESLN